MMNKQNLKLKKQILTIFFLFLIAGIIFNATYFIHAHKNSDGKLIIHSQPFSKAAEKESPQQHDHNKLDLEHIGSLDHFLSTDISYKIEYPFIFKQEVKFEYTFDLLSQYRLLIATRGPPNFI